MKVLQLISSGGFYGAESVLVNLSVEFQHAGHSCIVGVFENSGNTNTAVGHRAELVGLTVVRIPCRSRIDLRTVRQIRHIIEGEGVDLVHAHGYKADFYALLAARVAKAPVIATCHNWLGRRWAMRAYARLDRYLLRYFDGVVAVSESVAEQLRQSGVRERVHIISNGVPVPGVGSRSAFADQLQLGDRMVVGTVGRLSAEKGMSFLIEAASEICPEFPRAFFVLVGDGPLRPVLEARVRELGMEGRFLFAGQRHDVEQIYPAFDVFVLPSLEEGMPMALLEAMAAGLPAVATKVGGVPAVINDPVVGTIVEPGDANAIATEISKLLSSRTRREQIGSNARKRVEEEFSAAAMARRYSELYQQVLTGRREGDRLATPGLKAKTDVERRLQS